MPTLHLQLYHSISLPATLFTNLSTLIFQILSTCLFFFGRQSTLKNKMLFQHVPLPYKSNHLLRMAMEPKYLSEEVIVHPNHHLTGWLDPLGLERSNLAISTKQSSTISRSSQLFKNIKEAMVPAGRAPSPGGSRFEAPGSQTSIG